MGMNPTRFAIGASGALACIGLGLVAGVSAGTSHAGYVYDVHTLTTTVRDPVPATAATVTVTTGPADAAARTVVQTVVRTVTVPVTVTAVPHHKPHHKKDDKGPGEPAPGPGGDGG
jgi:hypothetical protein